VHLFPLIVTLINAFFVFYSYIQNITNLSSVPEATKPTTKCCFSILKQKMEMEEPAKEQPLSVGTLSFTQFCEFTFLIIHSCMSLFRVIVSIVIVTSNLVIAIELCGGSVSGSSAKSQLQRYPLRSSSKLKESKQDPPDRTICSESKRYFLMYCCYNVRLCH